MKGQWFRQRSIRTRILLTLVGLTSVILLAVALMFNLLIREYVRGRLSDQLESIESVVTSDRRGGGRKGPEEPTMGLARMGKGRKFDGGLDRITGVQGGAVALDSGGKIQDGLSGEEDVCAELAAWFSDGHAETVRKKAVSLESGEYLVSVVPGQDEADFWWICYVDVTAIQAFTRQVNAVLFGIILGAIVLSVLLSRWIADSFGSPVQALSAFAGEIGRGDFQRREFHFRDAEFRRLAESMNRMAEELQAANRKQETFFQNVSHELRTPLTSIRGNAEGIVCGIMDTQTSGKVILAEADRLGGFVEDLLYLSRLGKALPEGEAPPTDLREILSLCVSEQRLEAERRGLSFAFDFDVAPVLVYIHGRDARQLFGNLLSNAIRYAASTIQLSCHGEEAGAVVTVSDDGPGMAPEDLPHVFERFYKGPGGKHGIGLSIVKSIADLYHGTVTAESGPGARFTVRLPGEIS